MLFILYCWLDNPLTKKWLSVVFQYIFKTKPGRDWGSDDETGTRPLPAFSELYLKFISGWYKLRNGIRIGQFYKFTSTWNRHGIIKTESNPSLFLSHPPPLSFPSLYHYHLFSCPKGGLNIQVSLYYRLWPLPLPAIALLFYCWGGGGWRKSERLN